jgi:hypothetical protein
LPPCAERANGTAIRGELQIQLADVAAGRRTAARRADFEEAGVTYVVEHLVETRLRRGRVARRVLAIRGVEEVDVVLRRAEALVDDLVDLGQRGRHERATGSGDLEELILGKLPGLGRVCDEHDLELPVLPPQALHGPEEKRLGELAAVLAHARRYVEHQEHDRLRRRLLAARELAETQVVIGEGR